MPPILYLIDGHALAYRTFFALTSAGGGDRLKTRSGEMTAGIFGFASVLLRILEQEKPDYLAVAFDTGRTFRNDLYIDYKATRAKMPDELRTQIERIRQLVDAFPFPRLEQEGVEADDVLGSIARQAVAKGLGVKIITGDRDLLQLVDDRIIVNLAGNKLSDARDFNAAAVLEYLGVTPERVIQYKALVGDHSDNIPGVPGIGEKTALALLAQFSTLDDIYAHLEQVKQPAVRAKLEAGRELAYLSLKLVTIRTDVPLVLDIEKARTDHMDIQAVEALFRELEFTSLLKRLHALTGQAAPPAFGAQLTLFGEPVTQVGTPTPYHLDVQVVTTETQLKVCASTLAAASEIALDTETTGTDPLRCDLVGISLAVKEGQGYYIPVGHRTGEIQLALETVLDALRPALTSPQIPKIGHNLKYDYLVLHQVGLDVTPLSSDTMIAEFLINPASHHLGLKDMAEAHLGIAMTHIEELIGKGKNQRTMAEVTIQTAADYAGADAEVTLRLWKILQPMLEKVNAAKLFTEIEMPLLPVLAEMEHTGVLLDVPILREMSGRLSLRLAEIDQQVMQHVGRPFNMNSPQQLSDVLFNTLKLGSSSRGRKTSSGHISTSADVLEELRGEHPVVDLILEFRELSKLKSTYSEALPQQINPDTGRVHTSYNQTGSVTGRLASSDPNLQNIPTRTDLGRQVRRAFIAQAGWLLLSIDYSQIELRIVAHMANDEAMLAAFRAGQDIHATTAAAIYGVPLEQVTKEQRRHAKAINFGLIYGMSSFGLSRTTDLTLGEAEQFVKAYFERFPAVKSYLDGIRVQAARQGYVETLLGRRRYFPNLANPVSPTLRAREEREAINAPIQGTAADILKIAMVRLPPVLQAARLKTHLLLQVHDELVLEVPHTELLATARVVQDVMESAYPLAIPLLTDARWGENWGELKPISQFSGYN